MEQETSDLVLFFGRFHPMILHLPIGFLVMAFILEMVTRFGLSDRYKPAVGLILLLGTVSAIVTAALGLMLAESGGYNEDLLDRHKWSGIGLALAACASWLLWRWNEKKLSRQTDRVYLATLSFMMLAIVAAGHYGGSLTHGSDYLTRYMPDGLRAVIGLPPGEGSGIPLITNLPEADVYHDIIYPILNTRCISCHGEDKYEADLQMHTPELLQRGSEDGPVYVSGNAAESEMAKRIALPEEDEDRMPPEGRSSLSDEQIALIGWWIDSGSPFVSRVADMEVSDEIQSVLNTLVDPMANMSDVERFLASDVEPAGEEVVFDLREQGMQILPLSEQSNWLQVRVPHGASGDSLIIPLLEIREQLTWLNLGGTATTDHALESIGEFNNLTRLHLQNTEITDAGLTYLNGLAYLEYLNLYETGITDDGLEHLKTLSGLRQLYLWQTDVTEEGVNDLILALPELEVNMGEGVVIVDAGANEE